MVMVMLKVDPRTEQLLTVSKVAGCIDYMSMFVGRKDVHPSS